MHKMFAVAAALVAAAALFSCEKGLSPEEQQAQQEQEKTEKADQFWDVVGQLVAGSDITPDYKGKTFEPVIGVADALDPQTRIVATNSAAAAARSFANLVGVESIDENTPAYTWSQAEVGTLTYTKTDGSTSWAEVKVEIPSVPHLSKLIYRSAQQGDTNASFAGSAYYRFGDVISRTNSDNKTEYWVCVRPAFNPEGKGETHWMSIGDLPKENWWYYKSSNKKEYYLPTKLNVSKEHMQNLAEMLYAICYPDQWQTNVVNHSKVGYFGPYGLPIFHDFSPNNATYHNAKFWSNVAYAWRGKGIAQLLFERTLDDISRDIDANGLYFLYKGYSWNTWTSNSAKLYQAHFEKGSEENSNMHTKNPYSEPEAQMVYKKEPAKDLEFDVRNKKYVKNTGFFGDGYPRYIVRYATGAELSNTGKYSDVHKAIPGTNDVYRYYQDVLPVENLEEHAPEITLTKIVDDRNKQNLTNFNGIAYYKTGNIYKDEKDALWFVVSMAGSNNVEGLCEPSPYSELVSFSGLSRMEGSHYLAGLPTYEQAVRAVLALHSIFHNGFANIDEWNNEWEDLHPSTAVIRFISENARVNILRLFQVVQPLSGGDKNFTHMAGFAYSDPSVNTTGQPVGRYLFPTEISNADLPRYLWKHYPSNPSATATLYDAFSNATMFLQDVADGEKVKKYGPDLYATMGFHPDQATHGRTTDKRPYRTQPESLAQFPESYIYKYDLWDEYKYPADMWNEPVLMFRADAVYDRGDEYATITVNGHKLTLVKEFPLGYVLPDPADEAARIKEEMGVVQAFYSLQTFPRDVITEDGEKYQYPDWMRVWGRR